MISYKTRGYSTHFSMLRNQMQGSSASAWPLISQQLEPRLKWQGSHRLCCKHSDSPNRHKCLRCGHHVPIGTNKDLVACFNMKSQRNQVQQCHYSPRRWHKFHDIKLKCKSGSLCFSTMRSSLDVWASTWSYFTICVVSIHCWKILAQVLWTELNWSYLQDLVVIGLTQNMRW